MNPISKLRSRLPFPLRRLADLAYNYWWSWTPERLSLFSMIEPTIWQRCHHNPVELLESVAYERLSQVAEDPRYLKRLETLAEQFDAYLTEQDTWCHRVAPQLSLDQPVAYFCAEFGIHESLPIYCGGLGILAGDHLKSASDLGVPMIGIGLLYRQGYFRQHLNRSGWQKEYYDSSNFEHMPLELVRDEFGQPVTIKLRVRQRTVRVQVWLARIGRVNLYLLDTDREDNDPADRALTGHLYGSNQETRIAQEVLLGIGGIRILQVLEIEPSVYHLNEGHAAFALLEIASAEIELSSYSFYDVADRVRSRTVFTSHTPVPNANDSFSADMMDSFFADYWPQLGLSREQFLALGARRLGDPWEPFSMTVLALRMTRSANGVSQRHGEVSRQMWSILYPERSAAEVPIGQVTNGVHARTWTAPLMADLYDQYLGEEWSQRISDKEIWAQIDAIPDEKLWKRHCILKERLVAYARSKVRQSRQARGEATADIAAVEQLLNPETLTIGFARRFSPYKRGYLIFKDLHRSVRILSNAKRPIQLVFAGKAHPADDEGKRIIQRLIEWCRHPALRDRVAFIEDYDMYTAKMLMQGVDVWLNNPRRPLEASGTSGQKVALNAGINCSVLDGWWCEGYQEDASGRGINGWTIGKDIGTSDQIAQDQVDADSLYEILQKEMARLYYDRNGEGIPKGWVRMMKASVRTCAPIFNSDRMVAEYVTQIYAPETTIEPEPILASAVS
ncbi:MAG: glycosyltransferase family 1 protein [Leptolyngbyaceae cyanobacterium SM1_1_3]|nr:glycosyltransferase family 1 protein [Leptolyngbyaceae cyanobacterium SM1_1_3]NJM84917.1 glycosyltransferase family 1 protein [Leptolyngbyaceae cyanobacterium RM2_2_21]NJN02778.1 glycosyltransferase family 1 protein [Leptolyngbyaceae cyanobacterium RM1_1_2]